MRIDQNDLRWFALRCQPQKEQTAVRVLRTQDLLVCIPTETRWRRRGHYDKVKTERKFAAMPGYVLIGWGPGEIPWWSALRFAVITSVVGYRPPASKNDPHPKFQPLQLETLEVERMLEKDLLTAPGFYKFMRTWGEYNPGDQVRVVNGPYEGWESKVVAVRDGEAIIRLTVLGAERDVSVPAQNLEKAA